jgi:hypothetical protein
MRFDALLPAAHRDELALADRPTLANRHQAQKFARYDQPPIDRFAIIAQARSDVHRVAEKRELALGFPAFADDDGAGMQPARKAGATPNSAS